MATFDGRPTTKPLFVAWFTEETFNRFRQIYRDPKELPDNFHTWLRGAERALRRYAQSGAIPDKIIVDPDAMLAWARATGVDIKNKTRIEFAGLLFQKKGNC